MAYSELVKNFNHIRDYMREFYVYGFRTKGEFTGKSARTFDNECQRMENILGDYMRFGKTPNGKRMFMSVDTRQISHNPFYTAWKAASFADSDITLHFILMDILSEPDIKMTVDEITDKVYDYLAEFNSRSSQNGNIRELFDESTIRKKLNEYANEGIVRKDKRGKAMYYSRCESAELPSPEVLDFFSEVASCGVTGFYLMDKIEAETGKDVFTFKHHYITGALDSEVECHLLCAMGEKRSVVISSRSRRGEKTHETKLVPLRIMVSSQNGRRHLMAFVPDAGEGGDAAGAQGASNGSGGAPCPGGNICPGGRIKSYRLDNIISVKEGEVCSSYDKYVKQLDDMTPHMWGVSTGGRDDATLQHVEFTINYGPDEEYIHSRLVREARCGTVEPVDDHTDKFSADVYDASELVPWMRTFICRITSVSFSDKELERSFRDDIEAMYRMYGIECDGEGGGDK